MDDPIPIIGWAVLALIAAGVAYIWIRVIVDLIRFEWRGGPRADRTGVSEREWSMTFDATGTASASTAGSDTSSSESTASESSGGFSSGGGEYGGGGATGGW